MGKTQGFYSKPLLKTEDLGKEMGELPPPKGRGLLALTFKKWFQALNAHNPIELTDI